MSFSLNIVLFTKRTTTLFYCAKDNFIILNKWGIISFLLSKSELITDGNICSDVLGMTSEQDCCNNIV